MSDLLPEISEDFGVCIKLRNLSVSGDEGFEPIIDETKYSIFSRPEIINFINHELFDFSKKTEDIVPSYNFLPIRSGSHGEYFSKKPVYLNQESLNKIPLKKDGEYFLIENGEDLEKLRNIFLKDFSKGESALKKFYSTSNAGYIIDNIKNLNRLLIAKNININFEKNTLKSDYCKEILNDRIHYSRNMLNDKIEQSYKVLSGIPIICKNIIDNDYFKFEIKFKIVNKNQSDFGENISERYFILNAININNFFESNYDFINNKSSDAVQNRWKPFDDSPRYRAELPTNLQEYLENLNFSSIEEVCAAFRELASYQSGINDGVFHEESNRSRKHFSGSTETEMFASKFFKDYHPNPLESPAGIWMGTKNAISKIKNQTSVSFPAHKDGEAPFKMFHFGETDDEVFGKNYGSSRYIKNILSFSPNNGDPRYYNSIFDANFAEAIVDYKETDFIYDIVNESKEYVYSKLLDFIDKINDYIDKKYNSLKIDKEYIFKKTEKSHIVKAKKDIASGRSPIDAYSNYEFSIKQFLTDTFDKTNSLRNLYKTYLALKDIDETRDVFAKVFLIKFMFQEHGAMSRYLGYKSIGDVGKEAIGEFVKEGSRDISSEDLFKKIISKLKKSNFNNFNKYISDRTDFVLNKINIIDGLSSIKIIEGQNIKSEKIKEREKEGIGDDKTWFNDEFNEDEEARSEKFFSEKKILGPFDLFEEDELSENLNVLSYSENGIESIFSSMLRENIKSMHDLDFYSHSPERLKVNLINQRFKLIPDVGYRNISKILFKNNKNILFAIKESDHNISFLKKFISHKEEDLLSDNEVRGIIHNINNEISSNNFMRLMYSLFFSEEEKLNNVKKDDSSFINLIKDKHFKFSKNSNNASDISFFDIFSIIKSGELEVVSLGAEKFSYPANYIEGLEDIMLFAPMNFSSGDQSFLGLDGEDRGIYEEISWYFKDSSNPSSKEVHESLISSVKTGESIRQSVKSNMDFPAYRSNRNISGIDYDDIPYRINYKNIENYDFLKFAKSARLSGILNLVDPEIRKRIINNMKEFNLRSKEILNDIIFAEEMFFMKEDKKSYYDYIKDFSSKKLAIYFDNIESIRGGGFEDLAFGDGGTINMHLNIGSKNFIEKINIVSENIILFSIIMARKDPSIFKNKSALSKELCTFFQNLECLFDERYSILNAEESLFFKNIIELFYNSNIPIMEKIRNSSQLYSLFHSTAPYDPSMSSGLYEYLEKKYPENKDRILDKYKEYESVSKHLPSKLFFENINKEILLKIIKSYFSFKKTGLIGLEAKESGYEKLLSILDNKNHHISKEILYKALICDPKEPIEEVNFENEIKKLSKGIKNYKADGESTLTSIENKFSSLNSFNNFLSPNLKNLSDDKNIYINEIIRSIDYISSYNEQMDSIDKYYSLIKDKDVRVENINLDLKINNIYYKFECLKTGDPYFFQVGIDTDCCQVIGGYGAGCAVDSFINPKAGVLVLKYSNNKNSEFRILSQSYFHIVDGKNKNEKPYYILDNIESNPKSHRFVSLDQIDAVEKCYAALAKHLSSIGFGETLLGMSHSDVDLRYFSKESDLDSDPRHFEHDSSLINSDFGEVYANLSKSTLSKLSESYILNAGISESDYIEEYGEKNFASLIEEIDSDNFIDKENLEKKAEEKKKIILELSDKKSERSTRLSAFCKKYKYNYQKIKFFKIKSLKKEISLINKKIDMIEENKRIFESFKEKLISGFYNKEYSIDEIISLKENYVELKYDKKNKLNEELAELQFRKDEIEYRIKDVLSSNKREVAAYSGILTAIQKVKSELILIEKKEIIAKYIMHSFGDKIKESMINVENKIEEVYSELSGDSHLKDIIQYREEIGKSLGYKRNKINYIRAKPRMKRRAFNFIDNLVNNFIEDAGSKSSDKFYKEYGDIYTEIVDKYLYEFKEGATDFIDKDSDDVNKDYEVSLSTLVNIYENIIKKDMIKEEMFNKNSKQFGSLKRNLLYFKYFISDEIIYKKFYGAESEEDLMESISKKTNYDKVKGIVEFLNSEEAKSIPEMLKEAVNNNKKITKLSSWLYLNKHIKQYKKLQIFRLGENYVSDRF